MRVAVLHDYLNQFGGAERVLETILEIFPDADLYTLLYDAPRTHHAFARFPIRTSFLDTHFVRRHHRLCIPLMPLASRMLRTEEKYDLVVSSSAGYAKGFHIHAPYHVSYCHSPLRYAWDVEYVKDLPYAPWPLKEAIVHPIAKWLKRWDANAACRVNLFLANSHFIASKIRAYYGRDSLVIYPPVDEHIFYPDHKDNIQEYYLMAGRLLYYKVFHLGIRAFQKLKKRLVVVGAGPEGKKLAANTDARYITFLPHVQDEKLRVLYSNARALIFPQIEDFGLVAAEAQACGTPVITFAQGGGAEIVLDRHTGLHFFTQRVDAIADAVREFEKMKFDKKIIIKNAERFSKRRFIKEFHEALRRGGVPYETKVV